MNRRVGVRRRWWAALIAGAAALASAATARRTVAPATSDAAAELQRLTAAREALAEFSDSALRREEARLARRSMSAPSGIGAIRERAGPSWIWNSGPANPAGASWVLTQAAGSLQAWNDVVSIAALIEAESGARIESLEIEAVGTLSGRAFRRIKIVVCIGGRDSNRIR